MFAGEHLVWDGEGLRYSTLLIDTMCEGVHTFADVVTPLFGAGVLFVSSFHVRRVSRSQRVGWTQRQMYNNMYLIVQYGYGALLTSLESLQ